MAQPITWQTVRAGSDPAQAAPVLEQSRQTFGDAFSAFQNIIKQKEAVDNANMQATQEMGKQAFLDKLASARTPEELAALQRSGALDTSGLGVQARAALRGSEEARLTGLRQGVNASNTFEDTVRARTEQPMVDAIKAKVLAGDFTGAQTDLAASTIKDKAPIQQLIHDTGRQRLTEGRADALAPLTQETAVRANEQGRLTLAETQYQTQQTAQDRVFQTRLAEEAAKRQSEIAPLRAKVESVAKLFPNLGLPLNSDGTVALDRLNSTQETQLNEMLSGGKKDGPTLDMLRKDTQAAQTFREQLRREGARPDQLAKLDPAIASAFNTTPVAPIGADAAKLERNQRILAANAQMDAAQYAPMTTPGAAAAAKDVANQTIAQIHPVGSYRNENWRNAVAKFEGIIATDEKGKPILGSDGKTPIRVMPGPDAWKEILNGIDNSYFGWGNNDIANALKTWADKPENRIGAGRSVTNSLVNGLRAVDLEKPAPSPGITLPTKR